MIGLQVLDCQTEVLCGPASSAPPPRLEATPGASPAGYSRRQERPRGSAPACTLRCLDLTTRPKLNWSFCARSARPRSACRSRPNCELCRTRRKEAAVLGLVVNAGHTSHGGVLAGAHEAAAAFSAAVAAVLRCWGY